MKRVLLDSGIVSDLINCRRGIPDRIKLLVAEGTRVGICVPVLAEIAAGIALNAVKAENAT